MSQTERYPDAMLDIETMSTHPSNALILSIGIRHFDPEPSDGPALGVKYLIRPDISMQLLLGREVDPKTQQFWIAQSKAAQDDWMVGARHEKAGVCAVLDDACRDVKHLWANGIVFDIGNVASLLRQLGENEPWSYRAPRDARTIYEHTPSRRIVPIGDALAIEGAPHSALYDCDAQIHRLWQHWPANDIAHHPV